MLPIKTSLAILAELIIFIASGSTLRPAEPKNSGDLLLRWLPVLWNLLGRIGFFLKPKTYLSLKPSLSKIHLSSYPFLYNLLCVLLLKDKINPHWLTEAKKMGCSLAPPPSNTTCRSSAVVSEKETIPHFLCSYPALARNRFKMFGEHILTDLSEVTTIRIRDSPLPPLHNCYVI